MGRRVDRIINHIRSITENEVANSTTDITDEEILEYLNEAQHRIQSKILSSHPNVFVAETTISSVADQEEYSLPSDLFLANKILSVEYAEDGETFRKLEPMILRDRQSNISGLPHGYIRRDKLDTEAGEILLVPKPANSSSTIRLNYIQRIDELDKRRGIVSAITLDSGTSTITTLTLDTSGDPPIDSTDLANHDFICVVDSVGAMKMRNIRFDSVDTGTGAVTVNSNFTYASGETIAVGDYIVGGKDTNSHIILPRNVERYLTSFGTWKILKRDSSVDSNEATQELVALENDIVDGYADLWSDDVAEVPVIEYWS